MATRDPNLVSEHMIPAAGTIAIVREIAGEDSNTFNILNGDQIPGHLHADIIGQAKRAEDKKK